MSILAKPYFYNEAEAFKHVEAVLWPEGPVCHHCGSVTKPYKLEGVRSKPSKKNPEGIERHGLYKCRDCNGQFTVRLGAIFEESHIELFKWLQALHLMCGSKKGISAHQLHRTLEITYKSAWFLCHRIRHAMQVMPTTPLGGNGKAVEADETFIGRLAGVPKGKAGWGHKNVVLTLVERGGVARSFHIESVRRHDIESVVRANVAKDTKFNTDEANHYRKAGEDFDSHESVNHGREEYVRGDAHTNTVEGFYSIFKCGMKGVYQHCSEKHLHRYLAEFDFRYSNRMALGVNDLARSARALKGFTNNRLMYKSSGFSE